jgi:hypothetical protein
MSNQFYNTCEITTGNYCTIFKRGNLNNKFYVNRINNNILTLPSIPLAGLAYSITHLNGNATKSSFVAIGIWSASVIFNNFVTNKPKTLFEIKCYDSLF